MTIILSILATWRITSLFSYEEGPFNIFGRFRKIVKIDCFWCYSVWFGAFVSYLGGFSIVDWLAFSAGAIILEETICLALGVRSG